MARNRRLFAIWLMVSLLFTQLAVAAYACPVAQQSQAAMLLPCAQAMGQAGSIDKAQPSLCVQHCLYGNSHPQPAVDLGQHTPAALPVVFGVPLALAGLEPQDTLLTRSDDSRDRAPPGSWRTLHQRLRF